MDRSDHRPDSRHLSGVNLVYSVTVLVAMSFFSSLLSLTIPITSIHLFNRVLPSGSISSLISVVVIATLFIAAGVLMDGFRGDVLGRMANRLDLTYRPMAESLSPELRPAYYRDVDTVRQFTSSSAPASLLDLPSTIVACAAIFIINTSFGYMLIVAGMLLAVMGVSGSLSLHYTRIQARGINVEVDGLRATLEVTPTTARAMGFDRRILKGIASSLQRSLFYAQVMHRRAGWMEASSRGLRSLVQVLTLATGIFLAIRQEVEPGSIVALTMLGSRFLAPIERLSSITHTVRDSWAAWSRVRCQRPAGRTGSKTMASGLHLHVRAEAVAIASEALVPEFWPLPEISLSLKPGTVTVILGESGSGRSLLCKILVGLVQPSMGRVTVDGVEITRIDAQELSEQVGYLPDHDEIGRGSLRQIIERYSSGQGVLVQEAAKMAGVHDAIGELESGYGTWITGTRDVSSGMARQIGLARAFFGAPKLLILDEPTAFLGLSSIEVIAQALVRFRQNGATVLVATNSPQLTKLADQYVVLRKGHSPQVCSADQWAAVQRRGNGADLGTALFEVTR